MKKVLLLILSVCFIITSAAPSAFSEKLNVIKTGAGGGLIDSGPAGISCGITCTAMFSLGTPVFLTATAYPTSTFASWSGDATGTAQSCTVTMLSDLTVTALFDLTTSTTSSSTSTTTSILPKLNVIKAGAGGGLIDSGPAGISCGITCTAMFSLGTPVFLTATAYPTSTFASWSGDATGTAQSCTVTMLSDLTVTALFDLTTSTTSSSTSTTTSILPKLNVIKAGAGGGLIDSGPAGIACSPTCTASFVSGTPVFLTATADGSSVFTSWSGAGCSGAGGCSFSISSDVTVTAQFDLTTSTTSSSTSTTTSTLPNYALNVIIQGPGGGSIASGPVGIACSPTCTASFVSGTPV
ncbi:MAG: hypothetical protein WCQ99_00255, partial [Pseudomonadota bacterium]